MVLVWLFVVFSCSLLGNFDLIFILPLLTDNVTHSSGNAEKKKKCCRHGGKTEVVSEIPWKPNQEAYQLRCVFGYAMDGSDLPCYILWSIRTVEKSF